MQHKPPEVILGFTCVTYADSWGSDYLEFAGYFVRSGRLGDVEVTGYEIGSVFLFCYTHCLA